MNEGGGQLKRATIHLLATMARWKCVMRNEGRRSNKAGFARVRSRDSQWTICVIQRRWLTQPFNAAYLLSWVIARDGLPAPFWKDPWHARLPNRITGASDLTSGVGHVIGSAKGTFISGDLNAESNQQETFNGFIANTFLHFHTRCPTDDDLQQRFRLPDKYALNKSIVFSNEKEKLKHLIK